MIHNATDAARALLKSICIQAISDQDDAFVLEAPEFEAYARLVGIGPVDLFRLKGVVCTSSDRHAPARCPPLGRRPVPQHREGPTQRCSGRRLAKLGRCPGIASQALKKPGPGVPPPPPNMPIATRPGITGGPGASKPVPLYLPTLIDVSTHGGGPPTPASNPEPSAGSKGWNEKSLSTPGSHSPQRGLEPAYFGSRLLRQRLPNLYKHSSNHPVSAHRCTGRNDELGLRSR